MGAAEVTFYVAANLRGFGYGRVRRGSGFGCGRIEIEVYKGVEIALHEIYNELPEGGHINDALVKEKFKSLLRLGPFIRTY